MERASAPPHNMGASIDSVIGSALLGLVTGTCVLGIITVQTVYYCTTFRRDRLINQFSVAFLIFLNHFEMATVASNAYFGLISPGYKNPRVLMQVNWRHGVPEVTQAFTILVVATALTSTISSVCKCKVLTWVLRALILARFAYLFKIIIQQYIAMNNTSLGNIVTKGYDYIVLATLSWTTDILIFGSLFTGLLRSRNGNKMADAAIVRMIRYMAPGCILLLAWESAFSISTFTRSGFGAMFTGLGFGPVFNFIFLSMLHARSKLTYTIHPTGQLEVVKKTFGVARKPANACTVSIAKETVHHACDHGIQELRLMSRLEARFPEEAEVQSYYAEGISFPPTEMKAQRIPSGSTQE